MAYSESIFHFEKIDLAQGLYWYLADYHEGQWSENYKLLSQLGEDYRPGMLENGPEKGSDAEYTYKALEAGAVSPQTIFDYIKE